jgi:hypothetical protein
VFSWPQFSIGRHQGLHRRHSPEQISSGGPSLPNSIRYVAPAWYIAKSKIERSWGYEGKTTGEAPGDWLGRRALLLRGAYVSGFRAGVAGDEVPALWSGLAIRYIWVCQ